MSEDSEVLFPEKTVVINGEEIIIKPFTWSVWMKRASKYARSIVRSLVLHESIGNEGLMLADLVADGGEDLHNLVKLAVDKPEEWWDALMPDAGVELAAAVFSVNRDYFVQKVGPKLGELKASLVGVQSLPGSSAPAIPSTPSSPTP